MKTLRTQVLAGTTMFIGLSMAQQDPCRDILQTAFQQTVHTRQQFVEAVSSFQSRVQSGEEGFAGTMDVSVVLPAEVPIPLNVSGTVDYVRKSFDQQLSEFERNTNYKYDQDVELTFLPANQTAAWLECKRMAFQSLSLDLQVKGPTVVGGVVSIDVGLLENMKPAKVQSCRIRSAGVSYDMKAKNQLNEIQSDGAGVHFSFEAKSNADDFYFELITDKYAPVIIYLKSVGGPPPSRCEEPIRLEKDQVRDPDERIVLTDPIYLKTGEQVLLKLNYQVSAHTDCTQGITGWYCNGAVLVVENGEKEFDRITIRKPSPAPVLRLAVREEFKNVITYQASQPGWYGFRFFYNAHGFCDGGHTDFKTTWDRLNITVCH